MFGRSLERYEVTIGRTFTYIFDRQIKNMKVSSGREFRVADFIRQELADIIRNEMRDPRIGILSISDVKVSKDLSYADIYVSRLSVSTDSENDFKERELVQILNNAAGFLRSAVAKRHSMRITPKLRFHYDLLLEDGPRMEKVISQAIKADENRRITRC